jgi:RNA polymerase sigma-70 factor (ECF subfamily)
MRARWQKRQYPNHGKRKSGLPLPTRFHGDDERLLRYTRSKEKALSSNMTDKPGIAEIHDSYQPRILRYLTRLVGIPEAEDLTQEVLIKVTLAMTTFKGESQLSTWIYRIATNVALDYLRSPAFKRKAWGGQSEDQTPTDRETAGKEKSAEATLIRDEMNQCLRRQVDSLPQSYRTVVVLSEWEGLSNAEIAQILGLTVETVKIRLHRGRKRLKTELQGNCSFYHNEENLLACDPNPPPAFSFP